MPFSPTSEQHQVIENIRPVVMVQSIAGSAKTTTLAARTKRALSEGVSPLSLLLLCYTAAGVASLQERLGEVGIPVSVVSRIRIELIDDWAKTILQTLDAFKATADAKTKSKPSVAVPYYKDGESPQAFELALRALDDLVASPVFDDHATENFTDAQSLSQFFLLLQALKADPGSTLFEILYGDYPDIEGIAQQLSTSELMLYWVKAYEIRRTQTEAIAEDIPVFRLQSDCVYDVLRYLRQGFAIPKKITNNLRLVGLDEAHDMTPAFVELLKICKFSFAQVIVVGDPRQRVFASASGQFISLFDLTAGLCNKAGDSVSLPLSYSLRFSSNIADMLREITGDSAIKGVSRPNGHEDQVVFHSCGPDLTEVVINTKSILQKMYSVSPTRLDQPAKNHKGFNKLMVVVPQEEHILAVAIGLTVQKIEVKVLGLSQFEMIGTRPELQLLKMLLLMHLDSPVQIGDSTMNQVFDFAHKFFAFKEASAADKHLFSYHEVRTELASGAKTLNQIFNGPQFISSYVGKRAQLLQRWLTELSIKRPVHEFVLTCFENLHIQRWLTTQYAFKEHAKLAYISLLEVLSLIRVEKLETKQVLEILEALSTPRLDRHLGHHQVLLTCATASKGYQADTVIVGPLHRKFWSAASTQLELNRLYVAMSRAKDNLHLLTPINSADLVPAAQPLIPYISQGRRNLPSCGHTLDDLIQAADALRAFNARSRIETFDLYCSREERFPIKAAGGTWNKAKACWELKAEICPPQFRKYLRN